MTQEIKVRYSLTSDTLSNPSYCIDCYALVNGYRFVNCCGGQLSNHQLLNQADPVKWLEAETQKAIEATQSLLDNEAIVSTFAERAKESGRKIFDSIESAIPSRYSTTNHISEPAHFIAFLRGAK